MADWNLIVTVGSGVVSVIAAGVTLWAARITKRAADDSSRTLATADTTLDVAVHLERLQRLSAAGHVLSEVNDTTAPSTLQVSAMYYAANLVSDLRKPHCTDLRRSLSPLGMPPPADAPLKLYQDDGLLDQDAVWKAVDPALEEIVDEITRLVQENPASG